jgi:membrane protein
MPTIKQAWPLVKQAVSSWSDDYAPSMGAAIAYYTVFSIAPLLLIVIAVAGLVFGQEAARGEIVAQLGGLMGDPAAHAIEGLIVSVSQPGTGVLSSVIGIVVLLVGATTVFSELQDALDRIWRAPARARSGLWGLIRARVLSFGLILAVGFLLIASLVVSAALSALGKWWAPLFGRSEVLAHVVNLVASFGLITVMFALIYKIMPRVKVAWDDVWTGAAVTALLFTIGKFLIGLYIGKSSVASGFGAAGSLVVILLWVYYSAQIFLLGAEFTWVYAHTYGSLKGQPMPAKAPAVPSASQGDAIAEASAPRRPPMQLRPSVAATATGVVVAAAVAAKTPEVARAATRASGESAGEATRAPAASLGERTAAFVRRDPVAGVGLAVASGMVLRMLLGLTTSVLRRVHR